ncbi:Uncharacterised protein [Mycobacterium tuberculosis]|nr:Uncharacterised protein [Mycobacterium tuberculosis]
MPQLGIDDSRLASASGVPREASSAGIRNATPLMKRKDVAVTISESTTIAQREPFAISSWWHASTGPGRRRTRIT